MSRRYVFVLVLGLVVACGDDGGGPTTPSGTSTVTVTYPAGGTIFIGNTAQFEAQLTSSNGSTRNATNDAAWGSDAPAVATVSSTGLVTAVAAGQATIFADVNPRGSLLIRVYPDFGGSWVGNEVMESCESSGQLEGVCSDPTLAVGEVFVHRSSLTQTEASVNAVIVTGPETTATMTGTITVSGELQLPSAPSLPADPLITMQVQNWRTRADTPSRMTGTYEILSTVSGLTGSLTVRARLENVVKTSATTLIPDGSTLQQALRRLSDHLETPR